MLTRRDSAFIYKPVRRPPANATKIRNALQVDWSPFKVTKRGRYWEVLDADGALVCLTAYKKGAAEVVRRLAAK